MALAPSRIWARGAPSELMAGFARWRSHAQGSGVQAHHKEGTASVEADADKRTFRHWKNATTQRWNPPRYSQRRQAQLVRAAFVTGELDAVSASPKYAKFVERLQRQATHEVLQPLPTQDRIRLPRLSREEDEQEALRIARKAHERGPYAGRAEKRMFKGTKADRESRARARRVADNMEKMDSIIEEWRQDKLTEKNKLKPTSPL
ncbi:hypothetical protein MOBT1_000363 [Malassezia obtusa]|uniref:Large ribosomal subunit protein mL59 domain-containing protein n=1 Tax=Malassezia obtusa TaxID=76774 RepID=A0AAF0DY97_9BASI|nr:hypothetical protein MOBT1_000363 [Malassezia obtusa]